MPVSLRYLHAVFRSFGTSIGETILDRRLALCHSRLVADPHLRIGEVAYRAGFKSHAHFSTTFKARYGASPRDVQRSGASSRQTGRT
jgi:AraC-like DNA-binding protein